jgi:alpha-L-rhamnosidase
MPSFKFSRQARWIWPAESPPQSHAIALFRYAFEVDGEIADERLYITADSRYELFVNGQWLGHGPARSWPSPWPVDPFNLRGLLRPGPNVIAARVQRFGIGTFQYLDSSAGLLVELAWSDSKGPRRIVSDATWKGRIDTSYGWPTPRISCMQAWEEQHDAKAAEPDWADPALDDSAWPCAEAGHRPGGGDHSAFVLRELPQLTREAVAPARLIEAVAVRPAPYSWNLNPRGFLNAEDKSANQIQGQLLLATHIYSDRAQPASFHQPHHRPRLGWSLNGDALNFTDHSLQLTDTGVAHAALKRGWNTLMAVLPETEHYWWASISAWTDRPVRWSAYPDDRPAETAWLALGPFGNPDDPTPPPLTGSHQALVHATAIPAGATQARFQQIRSIGMLSTEDCSAPFVRPLSREMVAAVDVYAQCASERIVPSKSLRIENPDALRHDTADWTTINPLRGADVRLLLDFGREVVGYHEFEVDAPAGTIIDNHNFEFIQPDGRKNLTEGMNNSFRYVCRDGVQRYRTIIRRGFQYSWFSFRNFDRPIRVRFIRALMSTYPQARQGSFACSDAWLDRIWEVGAHSVHCCSEDAYTDCPSYEQTFWVGDGRNEALVDLVVNGDPRLSAHCWNLAAQSLDRSPLVESHAPSAWQNILPAWSFLWMRWTQEHFQFTGDRRLARSMLRQLRRNIDGIKSHLTSRGLFRIRAWNMFDWAPLDAPTDGEITHLNALAVLGLRQAASLATSLSAEREAADWNTLADRIAAAVNQHLWDPQKCAYIDCIHVDGRRSTVFSQQTHTAICIAGVATGARLKRSRQIMEQAPKGFVSAGSPFFMFFVLEGLARDGRFDEMVETIRRYWGPQVEAGASTFWEMHYPDRPRMTRSHCHGWSAAPTYFLSQHALGVQPLEPGFAVARIAPQPAGLSWARGSVPTPRGPISVSWRLSDGEFFLDLTLPPGIPSVIELPQSGKIIWLDGSGTRLPRGPRGIKRVRSECSRVRLKVIG